MNHNVCILVSSPSSYRDVFEISSKLLLKNWPSCPYKKYYSTDYCSQDYFNDFKVLLFPQKKNWVERVIESIKIINEDYVFLLTDDFFLSKKIDGKKFDILLDYMINNNIQYCRLYRNNRFIRKKNNVLNDIYILRYNQSYAISLLGAIWDRKHLLNFLQHSPKNAWELEENVQKNFSKKGSAIIDKHIYFHNDVFYHAVYKGKWMRNAEKVIKKNDLNFNSKREKISPIDSIMIFLKRFFRDLFNPKSRNKVKRFLSKIVNFDSKY